MSSLRRALVGGELVPGVPQVVKVNALQADSGQRGQPDPIADIRVGQRRAGRAGEDQRPRRGKPAQVLAHVGNDQIGEGHDAQTCPGLRRPERVTRLVVVELAGNPDGAGVQVDVFRTERGESAHRRLVKAASRISAR